MNYTLFLPVYKQGDDLAHWLDANNLSNSLSVLHNGGFSSDAYV